MILRLHPYTKSPDMKMSPFDNTVCGRNKSIVIAVDGPSSSGKGYLARAVAKAFGFSYLDTGKLYRIYAAEFTRGLSPSHLKNIRVQLNSEDEKKIMNLLNKDDDAYGAEEIGKMASSIACIKYVRETLLGLQQKVIAQAGRGIVVDGRDISTVVCPNADIKIYLTANASVRARRRFLQLKRGRSRKQEMYTRVFFRLLRRDIRDSTRQEAPLKCVKDAYYFDNSHLDKEKSLQKLMEKIKTFL